MILYIHDQVICGGGEFSFLNRCAFYCVIVLAVTSHAALNRSVEGRHPCLVLLLGESIQCFNIEFTLLALDFYRWLCYIEKLPSSPS